MEPKTCLRCGRTIEWRRKWKDRWEEVSYCSAACRKRPNGDQAPAIRQAILELLRSRARQASICPSEVARTLQPKDWRNLMEPVRRVARLLVGEGVVEITQQNRVVDPSTAKGPIRIRRGREFPES